ncbi:white collar 2 type of transcription factor [Mycoemilia scoparia]|uniref:White collar 2 type of transcription factor n=1 Tax=Mycoemilia scoparia TaxID=417184 RepID=A0A9W8DW87_9FUNG|nr:white collar 2 type of transcription factor [Mycoemilia scoparia]
MNNQTTQEGVLSSGPNVNDIMAQLAFYNSYAATSAPGSSAASIYNDLFLSGQLQSQPQLGPPPSLSAQIENNSQHHSQPGFFGSRTSDSGNGGASQASSTNAISVDNQVNNNNNNSCSNSGTTTTANNDANNVAISNSNGSGGYSSSTPFGNGLSAAAASSASAFGGSGGGGGNKHQATGKVPPAPLNLFASHNNFSDTAGQATASLNSPLLTWNSLSANPAMSTLGTPFYSDFPNPPLPNETYGRYNPHSPSADTSLLVHTQFGSSALVSMPMGMGSAQVPSIYSAMLQTNYANQNRTSDAKKAMAARSLQQQQDPGKSIPNIANFSLANSFQNLQAPPANLPAAPLSNAGNVDITTPISSALSIPFSIETAISSASFAPSCSVDGSAILVPHSGAENTDSPVSNVNDACSILSPFINGGLTPDTPLDNQFLASPTQFSNFDNESATNVRFDVPVNMSSSVDGYGSQSMNSAFTTISRTASIGNGDAAGHNTGANSLYYSPITFLTTAAGYIFSVNGQTTNILGYSHADMTQRMISEFISPEDVCSFLKDLGMLHSNGMFSARYRFVKRDKAPVLIDLEGIAFTIGGGNSGDSGLGQWTSNSETSQETGANVLKNMYSGFGLNGQSGYSNMSETNNSNNSGISSLPTKVYRIVAKPCLLDHHQSQQQSSSTISSPEEPLYNIFHKSNDVAKSEPARNAGNQKEQQQQQQQQQNMSTSAATTPLCPSNPVTLPVKGSTDSGLPATQYRRKSQGQVSRNRRASIVKTAILGSTGKQAPSPQVFTSQATGTVAEVLCKDTATSKKGTATTQAKPRKRKKNRPVEDRICSDCRTRESPEWRKGPLGPKTLCNACGLRWAKKNKKPELSLQQQQQPAPQPQLPQSASFQQQFSPHIIHQHHQL